MIHANIKNVWAFDAEWVPDVVSGRMLYNLSDDLSELEVMEEMWRRAGATPENPRPYLKTVYCRVVSISTVIRNGDPKTAHPIELRSLPGDLSDPTNCTEQSILSTFLNAVGKHKPRLVGFNSSEADLKIFAQRSIVHGLYQREFCDRPTKRFDEGADYFSKFNEHSTDLRTLLCSWGQGGFALNDIATISGIPGKFKNSGADVVDLWLQKKWDEIVAYNEFDALTTYLVWLRAAHFAGMFSTDEFRNEENLVRELIARLAAEPRYAHLLEFQAEWDRLRSYRKES